MKLEELKEEIGKAKMNGDDMPEGLTYGEMPFDELKNVSFYRPNTPRMNFVMRHWKPEFNTLLDLGCNAGHLCFVMKKSQLASIITGIDNDKNAIKVAKKVNDYFDCGITFECCDLLDYSFVSFFDVIFYLSTFQWVVQKHGLEKAKNHLRMISEYCKYMFFETAGSDSKAPLPVANNKSWIDNLLKDSGFKVLAFEKLKAETGDSRWIYLCLSKKF